MPSVEIRCFVANYKSVPFVPNAILGTGIEGVERNTTEVLRGLFFSFRIFTFGMRTALFPNSAGCAVRMENPMIYEIRNETLVVADS